MDKGRFAAKFDKFYWGFLAVGGIALACTIIVAAVFRDTPDPKDVIKARLLANLRAGLPEITIVVSRNDEQVASAIAQKMRAGETVPDSNDWVCGGIPGDTLDSVEITPTDYDRFRWALKHSLIRVQDVGPYKDRNSRMKTQKCVVLTLPGADKNVTLAPGNVDPTKHVVTVKVAQIDDISLDKIDTETYEDERTGHDRKYVTGFHVSFSGSVKNIYRDVTVTPGFFSGNASFTQKAHANNSSDLVIFDDPLMPSWNIAISP